MLRKNDVLLFILFYYYFFNKCGYACSLLFQKAWRVKSNLAQLSLVQVIRKLDIVTIHQARVVQTLDSAIQRLNNPGLVDSDYIQLSNNLD